ncbi:hypothetical protein [Methylobacterium brachiatum]|uniref:hypothetical protein n=1 Tax=Methylobacterium brachiatum TaxID=269660 RepID=UPI002447004E|nr:hypothetical protein [Methylobacterium brachiatum]MDH2314000.1 hypothetical protein [Methylobacterium brachiatum]
MSHEISKPRYRSRIPCDPEYALALGQAAYSYSYLEWQAICVARKLKTDFIAEDMYTWPAGKIARAIYEVVKEKRSLLPDPTYRKVKATVAELWDAAELRNDMLHAYPYTSSGGAQRLGRRTNGKNAEWTFERFDAATAFFEDLSVRLNDIFYKDLPDSDTPLLALPKPEGLDSTP